MTMDLIFGQAGEMAEANKFAESFGFGALVAVILLGAFIWIMKTLANNWTKNNDLQTASEIASRERLTKAQELSYVQHTEVASSVLDAVKHLVDIEERNSRAVELIAAGNEADTRLATDTRTQTQALHEAARKSIRVAADIFSDQPEFQNRLNAIADELDRSDLRRGV